MKFKIYALAALAAGSAFWPAQAAQAGERYCREYTRSITIDGRLQSGYGTACYQPDGSWEIVNLQGPEPARVAVREDIRNDFDRIGFEERDFHRGERIVVIDRRPTEFYGPHPAWPPYPGYRAIYYKPWPPGHYKKQWKSRDHWDRGDRWDDDRPRRRHHRHHDED